jgi:large subunit ribosomal protein L10
MATPEKVAVVEELTKDLASSKGVYLADFTGLSVEKVTQLRRAFRKSRSRFVVAKNTLAKRAIKGSPLEPLSEHFRGPTGIAYSLEDPVAPAKVLTDFGKENEGFKVKVAFVQGSVLGAKEIGAISSLPPKEVLVAQALGIVQSPMRGLVTVLTNVMGGLVTALEEIRKQKEASSPPPAQAAAPEAPAES